MQHESELERRRRQGREASRRWRAKRARGGSIKHAIPAPDGVKLREIPGYSNYRVDACGNLYTRIPIGGPRFENGPYIPWRVLPMQLDQKGRYWTVTIRSDGARKRKRVTVHSIVARAFLGPRPHGMFVAHGAEGPLDNSPENLSYKTPAQNKADEIRDGTRYAGNRHHATKQISHSFWNRWNTGEERKSDLCREIGISRQLIYRRIRRSDPCQPHFAGALEGLILGGTA